MSDRQELVSRLLVMEALERWADVFNSRSQDMDDDFCMRPGPMQMSPEQINNLVERGMLPQGTQPLFAPSTEPKFDEHPTASWLYRRFKAGSDTLTKDQAYRIGNQLDAQRVRIKRLQEEIETLRSGGGDLVRKIMAAKESLTSLP